MNNIDLKGQIGGHTQFKQTKNGLQQNMVTSFEQKDASLNLKEGANKNLDKKKQSKKEEKKKEAQSLPPKKDQSENQNSEEKKELLKKIMNII